MDKIDHATKGRLMNIKENFYVYSYTCNNKLIHEQKAEESNHKNISFDIAYAHTRYSQIHNIKGHQFTATRRTDHQGPPEHTHARAHTHTHTRHYMYGTRHYMYGNQ
jgi:hypothetical protein